MVRASRVSGSSEKDAVGSEWEVRMDHASEIDTCFYRVSICVPALCISPVGETSEADAPIRHSANSLLDFMESLKRRCLLAQGDWWRYELCFGKGIRQFHMDVDTVMDKEGKLIHRETLKSEYILGNAPLELYGNMSAIAHAMDVSSDIEGANDASNIRSAEMGGGISGRNHSAYPNRNQKLLSMAGLPIDLLSSSVAPRLLKLEFEGGTPCDLVHINRSTTVEIKCGKEDILVDIVEDRTCHYYFRVEMTALCKHPEFAPQEEKLMRVSFGAPDLLRHGSDIEIADEKGTIEQPAANSRSLKDIILQLVELQQNGGEVEHLSGIEYR
jgi:hypothetical protein